MASQPRDTSFCRGAFARLVPPYRALRGQSSGWTDEATGLGRLPGRARATGT